MKKEAEKFAGEDRKQKEMIDIRNQSDNLIHTCEKTIKDAGDKIKEESRKEIEEKIDELKKVKDGQDIELLKKANQELEEAIQKIGAAMYEEAKASAETNSKSAPSETKDNNPEEDSKKEEPIEGEFEEGSKENK